MDRLVGDDRKTTRTQPMSAEHHLWTHNTGTLKQMFYRSWGPHQVTFRWSELEGNRMKAWTHPAWYQRFRQLLVVWWCGGDVLSTSWSWLKHHSLPECCYDLDTIYSQKHSLTCLDSHMSFSDIIPNQYDLGPPFAARTASTLLKAVHQVQECVYGPPGSKSSKIKND